MVTTLTRALSPASLPRISEMMSGYVDRGTLPGYVSLVSRQGEEHVAYAGVLALDSNEPMQRDTIFRIASMTKPITAVAAMILIEECVLRLDDPVDAFLPELADRQVLVRPDAALTQTVPANRPITLRDLLTFRLGYGYLFAEGNHPQQQAFEAAGLGFTPDPQGSPEPDEWMRRLGELPLMHQPGEAWLYNAGADVLGVLIARASGLSFPDFMQQRIFDPLGMADTGFTLPANKLPRMSTNYFTDPETGALDLFDAGPTTRWVQPPTFPSGGAGLVSTIDDMHAFGQMLLGHGSYGGGMILSRPSVELMTSDQLTPAQKTIPGWAPSYWESHGWGFGGAVTTRQDEIYETVGRYGWDGGLGTSWYIDPREAMVTILLTQASFTSAIVPDWVRDFATSAYQAISA